MSFLIEEGKNNKEKKKKGNKKIYFFQLLTELWGKKKSNDVVLALEWSSCRGRKKGLRCVYPIVTWAIQQQRGIPLTQTYTLSLKKFLSTTSWKKNTF